MIVPTSYILKFQTSNSDIFIMQQRDIFIKEIKKWVAQNEGPFYPFYLNQQALRIHIFRKSGRTTLTA